MTTDWLAFWDSPHSIYVNARHKDVHYRLIAKEIAPLVPGPQARVLDYGCGEALHADLVAAAAGELFLCEAAPGVREGLVDRFAGQRNIHVLAPHEAARLQEHSLDLIVLHSVVQYLTVGGASAFVCIVSPAAQAGGMLVVSDVIPPNVPAVTDAFALLRFGAGNGFFFAAAWGLLRTLLSNYWKLRSKLGLTRYANAAMIEKLDCRRLQRRACAGEFRPQPGAQSVLRAAAVSAVGRISGRRNPPSRGPEGETAEYASLFRRQHVARVPNKKAARGDLAGGLVKVGCALSGSDFTCLAASADRSPPGSPCRCGRRSSTGSASEPHRSPCPQPEARGRRARRAGRRLRRGRVRSPAIDRRGGGFLGAQVGEHHHAVLRVALGQAGAGPGGRHGRGRVCGDRLGISPPT